MSDLASILAQLHETVAKELLDRIKSGEASAADFGAAIKFLKDNGIDTPGKLNPAVGSLAAEFEYPEDVDENVVSFGKR